MSKFHRVTPAILAFAASTFAIAPPVSAQELPTWLAGCWMQSEGEVWTEECWTLPRAGIMLGSSRTGESENLRFWETMQLVLDQENEDGPVLPMALWASPRGEQRTLFAWSPSDAPGVTFVNASNDYPQKIRYWREGDLLKAEISMLDGANANSWTYRAMGNSE